MCHPAGEDCPREPVEAGQTKVALDAEHSVWASVGFTSAVIQQFLVVIKKPSDVNGCRAETKDQAHKFTRALEQGSWRFALGHWGRGGSFKEGYGPRKIKEHLQVMLERFEFFYESNKMLS